MVDPVATGRHGWLVVGVLFFVVLVSSGHRGTYGNFLHPLLDQLGTTRAAVSLAFTANRMVFGFAQPLVGRALDRHGWRAVVLPSSLLVALGMLLLPFVRELWQLYALYGGVLALGLAGTSTAVAFPVAVRWVRQRRGPVLGLLAAAGMVGTFIFTPGSMFVLLQFGWQASAWTLAALSVVVVLPLALRLVPEHAPAAGSPAPAGTAGEQLRLADLLRTRTFWMLALPISASGFSGALVEVHFVPLLLAHGQGPQFAANVLGLISGLGLATVLATGFVVERVGFKRVLVLIYIARALGVCLAPFVDNPLLLAAFVLLVGLSWGGIQPATSGVVGDAFGHRSLATVLGWVFFFQNILGSTAAVIGGATYDILGSYDPVFLLTGVLLFIGGLLTATIALPARAVEPAL